MTLRCFTPSSADRELSRLRPAAERMCRLYRFLEGCRSPGIAPEQPVDRGYFALLCELHAACEEIGRSGARVRDARAGLVDFPARRRGRPVLLCWRVGEPALAFWHELDAGPDRRRPVEDDGAWEEG